MTTRLPVPASRSARLVATLLLASVGALSPADAQQPEPANVVGASERCLDSAATTTPARLDSMHVAYVEPETVVVGSDDRILVAGNPVFVWRRANAGYDLLARDSLFGIVIDSGASTVRGIPTPLPGRTLDAMRAAALPGGWWLATFAEVVPSDRMIHPPVVAMWAGETDGTRWRSLQRLPAAPDSLDAMSVSRLDLRDGRVRLAAVSERDHERRVVVFARDSGRWMVTEGAFGSANYAVVGSTRSHDLLAIVRWDTTEARDANSLFLYSRSHADSAWNLLARVVRGLGAPVHDPQFVPDDEEPLLVWQTADDDGHAEAWLTTVSGQYAATKPPMHFGSDVRVFETSARGRSAVVATTNFSRPGIAQLFEIHHPERIGRVSTRETAVAGLTSVALARDRAVVIHAQSSSSPRDPAVISLLETHAWRCR